MTAKVSVAMFGSSLVSAYWNGAATYYRGIIRALDECGFDVTFYEPDAYSRQQHRDMADPSWAGVVVYPATQEGVQKSLEQARDAAAILSALTPEQARRIGDRARRRLLSEHTYRHRAQELRKLLVDQITVGALGARRGEEKHRAAL